MKSMEKWKINTGLVQWERETISLEYTELGESREKLKWFMNISAIDNKHCEILQSREPMGLEKRGSDKRQKDSQVRE